MKNPIFFAFCAILLLTTLALSGCGKKEIISVPTPTKCVEQKDIPAEPERVSGKLTGKADEDVATLAVSALDLRDWGGKLRALLRGCE